VGRRCRRQGRRQDLRVPRRGEAVGLKCGANREEADELVATYPEDVSKMAYIGRSGWNIVRLGGAVPDDEILELIDTSYETIVAKLPKSRRP
jgi:predicted DNA-binding protein (MmcQ/YjbR family)